MTGGEGEGRRGLWAQLHCAVMGGLCGAVSVTIVVR